MTREHSILADRVAVLEQKVADLAAYLQAAIDYISTDPQSSLTKSRVTLEKLLLRLYRHVMKCEPRRPMIGDILADKAFVGQLPRRILARLNAVREMSNLGPHGEDVDVNDAVRVMQDIVDVLEWYAINFDPAMGAVGSQEPRDTIEILPDLKKKYPNYLRPDVVSVKFVQSKGQCYLEMKTAEVVGNYLRTETTRLEDLAFIVSGNDVLFSPADSIADNARKFVTEMDEISIIHCTDLFPEAIATQIDHAWRSTRGDS